MKTQLLYQRMAQLVCQNKNCVAAKNVEWEEKSRTELMAIAKNELPSGSGIDCGTKIDLDASNRNKLVLLAAYHHMNESGMYDGWTEHRIIVVPDLASGFTLNITGRNRNGIKEYLYDTYWPVLNEPCKH